MPGLPETRRRPGRTGLLTARAASLVTGTLVGLVGCADTSVLTVSVGDCLASADLAGGRVSDVSPVPCREAHDAEVYAELTLPDGDYPGLASVRAAAENFCLPQLAEFVGVPYLSSDLDAYPLLPTSESWAAGDRTVSCIVVAPEPVTGTLEGANR